MSTILQIANADRNLTLMSKGLKAANLEETLSKQGPFTILAPVNLAFSGLTPSYDELLKSENTVKLSELLSCYILSEKKLHKNFINGQKLKTLNGKEMTVTVKDGVVRINGAKILSKDRQGSNGVVHSMDALGVSS